MASNSGAVPIKLNHMFGSVRGQSRSPQGDRHHRSASSLDSINIGDTTSYNTNGTTTNHSRNSSNSSIVSHYKPQVSWPVYPKKIVTEPFWNSNQNKPTDDSGRRTVSQQNHQNVSSEGSTQYDRLRMNGRNESSYKQYLGNIQDMLIHGSALEMKQQLRQSERMKSQILPSPKYSNLRSKRSMNASFNDSIVADSNTSDASMSDASVVHHQDHSILQEMNTNTQTNSDTNDTHDDNSAQKVETNPVFEAKKENVEDWVDVRPEPSIKQPKRRKSSKQQRQVTDPSVASSTDAIQNTQPSFFLLDPMTPGILSAYLQTMFNFGLLSIFIYFFYLIISTVRRDIDQKVEEYSVDILAEMAQCSHEYIRNNCMPGKRVPALESMCNNWERCMNQDPAVVGRAKVSAETFAEILNGFIEPISVKSMLFLAILCAGAFFVNNVAFGFNSRRYFQTLHDNEKARVASASQQALTDSSTHGENRLQVVYARPPRHYGSLRKVSRKRSTASH